MDRQLPSLWNNMVFPFHKSVVYLGGVGTGFLIGSDEGRSLILTCEHVTEKFRADGLIVVQLLGGGVLPGHIIYEDKDNDITLVVVMPSHAPDPVITGQPLHFSDHPHSDKTNRDLVMLGHFSINNHTIKEPGTSHGYLMGDKIDEPQNLVATYTSQVGTSGSCVFFMGEGPCPLVIGMHSCSFYDSTFRCAVSATAIRSSLNKFCQTPAEKAIPDVIQLIFETL